MWNKLTEDSALVLLCDVSELSEDRIRDFESVIPAERLRKADAFRFREDRLLSVAASALMIKGIRFFRGDAPSGQDSRGNAPPGQEEEPAVFARGRWGKPELAGSSVKFSISHSGRLAACAFSAGEVGLDVEQRRDRPFLSALEIIEGSWELISKTMRRFERETFDWAPAFERETFDRSPAFERETFDRAAFDRLPEEKQCCWLAEAWSCLESILKLEGTGLAGIRSAGIRPAESGDPAAAEAARRIQSGGVSVYRLELPEGYAGFLSTRRPVKVIQRWV